MEMDEAGRWNNFRESVWMRIQRCRGSRKSVLIIAFLGLLLDNVLLTVVVPIIPDYLIELDKEAEGLDNISRSRENVTCLTSHCNISQAHNVTYQTMGMGAYPLVPENIINENSELGWLFSSKAIIQLFANPFVGPLTNRYGHTLPLMCGFVILFISSILYAFGNSYWLLFVARAIQGIGSSCTAIAGLSLLAGTYTEDKDRSRAMGIVLGGLALGVLIGYPFGGFMYQYVGKMIPFLIIAGAILLYGGLQFLILEPASKRHDPVCGTPLYILLSDPYIVIASGAILFPEMAIAMLEPTLPIWMLDKMHPEKWQLGTVFLPDSIGYLIATNLFGFVAHKIGRWICTAAALLLMGICLICIPFATRTVHLIVPHFGLGVALGVADVAVMPLLALLVEERHVAVYGSVYAIAQVSISLAFAIGPSIGGQVVKAVGFSWLIRGMAIVNILYSPVCYFLRNYGSSEESKAILMKDPPRARYSENGTQGFKFKRLEEE